MIEYIFFDAALRDRFVGFAEQRGVPCSACDDSMGLIVAIPEDLADDLMDEIEDRYDALQEEQSDLLAQTEGGLKRLAGFRFNLPDGQTRMLPLQAEMANRLMASFSLGEIQGLFEAVAHCTLNPNDEHLCKILAAQAQKDD
ncbi:MAG: hypothetical protein ABI479_01855 [Gallionella sp.]